MDGTNAINNPRFLEEIDPSYSPSTAGDLRLFPGTSIRNKGYPFINNSSFDLAGNPRVQENIIDIGAFEGSVLDFEKLWNTDFDNDGIPYGVEIALGGDPENPLKEEADNFSLERDNNDNVILTIGRNPSAPPGTSWIISRSTTLLPESFEPIFIFDGAIVSLNQTGSPPTLSESLIKLLDKNPPFPRAFYRFEAHFYTPEI